MEKNDGDNGESAAEVVVENELPFGSNENMIAVMNELLRHGRQDLPFNMFPGLSTTECQSKVEQALRLAHLDVGDKPTLVDWIRSGLFEENECNVSLALLFIALYEQHPLLHEKNVECDYRELYHFLYKVTANQPVPYLSHKSAIVLHKLLSELIDEVWPNTQPELLQYLSKIHIYSRSPVRRTYSRKRTLDKSAAENLSP